MALKPFIVIAPGEIIRDELEARGWTQSQFAKIMGRPYQVVNGIINGKREITPQTALQLAAAFGSSPEMWARMEAEFRLFLAEQTFKESEAIAERARRAS